MLQIDKWYLVDADAKILGRLASFVSCLLIGKYESLLKKNINIYVVVINIGKIQFTGKKEEKKIYYRYSGFQGGLKKESLKHLFSKYPDRVLYYAVKGMLPKNKFGSIALSRLKLFVSTEYKNYSHKIIKLDSKLIKGIDNE